MTSNPALRAFQNALVTATPTAAQAACDQTFAPDAVIKLCHPFGTVTGTQIYDALYAPLLDAMPDLERRDMIVLSGTTPRGRIGSAAWAITWARCCARGLAFRPPAT